MNVFNLTGPEFLEFYIVLLAGCVTVALVVRWRFRYPADDPPLIDLDAMETAYLAGAARGVVDAAVASLLHREALKIRTGGQVPHLEPADYAPINASEVESAVHDAVLAKGEKGATLQQVRSDAGVIAERIGDRLRREELVLPAGRLNAVRAGSFMIVLVCLAVGIIKICIGVSRNRPVGFLVMLCIVTLIIGIVMITTTPHRTRRGDKLLARLRTQNAALKISSTKQMAPVDLMLAMALFGPAVLAGDHADFYRVFRTANSGGGGCGSSGCGGGGCGGGGCGGGGCGGCGS